MKLSYTFKILLIFLIFTSHLEAQQRRNSLRKPAAKAQKMVSNIAVIIDERLAVLRAEPSLYAVPVQRMRRGRIVRILAAEEADGVRFYRISVPPNNSGWVQAEAVAAKSRRGDDERLAQLVQASEGFDQIERAKIFLENFGNSPLRSGILLLFGDLIEEQAVKLSNEAGRRLERREMAASGAPLHSFYLNYSGLDRFRRLGVRFFFNVNTRTFHYDGKNWREIIEKFPNTAEAFEAQKRLDSLKEKLESKDGSRKKN